MIPAFLVARFGPTGAKFAFFGTIAIAIAIGIAIFVAHERTVGKNGEVNRELTREVKVQQQVGTANGKAAETRAADTITIQNQAQELHNATVNAKSPNDARRQRGCVIMRQQGRDTSGIAACQ